MDAPERQQWNKGLRFKEAVISRKQEGIQQDYQKDFWTGSHEVSNRVFHWAAENE
jgi:hypothetical protein